MEIFVDRTAARRARLRRSGDPHGAPRRSRHGAGPLGRSWPAREGRRRAPRVISFMGGALGSVEVGSRNSSRPPRSAGHSARSRAACPLFRRSSAHGEGGPLNGIPAPRRQIPRLLVSGNSHEGCPPGGSHSHSCTESSSGRRVEAHVGSQPSTFDLTTNVGTQLAPLLECTGA